MTGDALRREADQHDRNASIILSVQLPSYEDLECAARETEHAKDKRALADSLDSARTEERVGSSTDKKANVQQYNCNGGANQRWEFVDAGDGQYAIRNVNSGLVLDVAGDSKADGANVQQFQWNSGKNQRWTTRGSNKNFELVNLNSGKCMEVQGGGKGNNVNIVQSQCNGKKNQRWYAGYALPGTNPR